MIQSMTGYGKAMAAYKDKKIHVEVKSLNSKALDLSTRIAPVYREREMEIRQTVAKVLVRGKVDVSIWIEKEAGSDAVPINGALVQNYYEQIRTIASQCGIPEPQDWWVSLLRLPDALYRFRPLAAVGLPDAGFYSTDYFPLVPWLFLFVCGFFGWRALVSLNADRFFVRGVPLLDVVGKYTLWIYLIHQPLLMGVCFLMFGGF